MYCAVDTNRDSETIRPIHISTDTKCQFTSIAVRIVSYHTIRMYEAMSDIDICCLTEKNVVHGASQRTKETLKMGHER
jgi:hypothetical protein